MLLVTITGEVVTVVMSAVREIASILAMLLPIMFPREIPLRPLRAASTEVESSGSEVPIAIPIRAMMNSETPNSAERLSTELMTNIEPMTRTTPPTKERIISVSVSLIISR